jgi:acetolactate decarboxylase
MGFDASLVAAASLRRSHGLDNSQVSAEDATHQLQLAHVLLDGGYDGVATLEEALAGGDHGLGTVDKLDGELIVVDGEPWRVNSEGRAELMPLETRTPFVIVTSMDNPITRRISNMSRTDLVAEIESMAQDDGAVVAVRVEGEFESVLIRSVPAQSPPYRPYVEVCVSDEVRWTHEPFEGVFVGFKFPDLEPGSTIPGLHLHGLNAARTTGGHNHEMFIKDAMLTIDVSREVVMHLPDKSMADLLNTPRDVRSAQRALLRAGHLSVEQLALELAVDIAEATRRMKWLADRGFVVAHNSEAGDQWTVAMKAHTPKKSPLMNDILDAL